MNAKAFGGAAVEIAPQLEHLPIVIVSENFAQGYLEMARARRMPGEFACMAMLGDRRAEVAYLLAMQIMTRFPQLDQRRTFFDQVEDGTMNIDGRTILDHSVIDPSIVVALRDLLRFPDVLVARSMREAERIRMLTSVVRASVVRWFPRRELPPFAPASRRKPLVVVWGGELPSHALAMHSFALHELHAELVGIVRGGTPVPGRMRFVELDHPSVPDLLASAACVVDASIDDPSWSYALAERGVSLAVALTSGADEAVDNVSYYMPSSYRSIWSATVSAMARRGAVPRGPLPDVAEIAAALERERPQVPQTNALVSVVIPTYNRHDDLPKALESVASQTYPNLEIVVLNDGGAPCAQFAAIDPRIRVVDRDFNVGPIGAINAGIREATGEYIQLLADDDALYPDHIARLLDVLERTGASIAHSNIVIRYETAGVDGTMLTTGYNSSVFAYPVDRTVIYASSPVAGQALLMRRAALDHVGLLDESTILADQEIQLRLSKKYEFLHLDRVTGEWLVREKRQDQISTSKDKDIPGALKRMFESHPATGRPYIEALRVGTLANVASRDPGYVFPPTLELRPKPEEAPA
jgi:hypothetical protein